MTTFVIDTDNNITATKFKQSIDNASTKAANINKYLSWFFLLYNLVNKSDHFHRVFL